MSSVIKYNEDKVDEQVAERIMIHGIDGHTRDDITDAFSVYEAANIRTENVSFHLSINPDPNNPDESYTDEQACNIVKDIMKKMGYGEQPYVLYKHHDIDRVHYHVISINIKKNGRSVDTHFSKLKIQKAVKELEEKYGFVLAKKKSKKEKKTTKQKHILPIYTKGDSNLCEKIREILSDAMRYHFTTENQFRLIMRAHNIDTEIFDSGEKTCMYFFGLDENGKRCTPMVQEDELGVTYEMMKLTMEKNSKEGLRPYFRIRSNMSKIIENCMKIAKNEQHLSKLLARHGIQMELNRGTDGKVAGGTFISHNDMAAFKLSQMTDPVNASLFANLAQTTIKTKDTSQKAETAKKDNKKTDIRNTIAGSALLSLLSARGGSSGGQGSGKEHEELTDDEKEKLEKMKRGW